MNSKRIFILEDNLDTQRILQGALKGYDLDICGSLKEFYALVKSGADPALMLLDVVLADGNGMEVFAHLHKQERWKNIPVIFISGKGELNQRQRGFSLGAADFIMKPFDPFDLRARVENSLRQSLSNRGDGSSFEKGDLFFDLHSKHLYHVTPAGRTPLAVPRFEFEILNFLVRHEDFVFTKDQIQSMARKLEDATSSKAINKLFGASVVLDDHMEHLRDVLDRTSFTLIFVEGKGYQLIRRDNPFRMAA